jgi:NAD(P)-dependent dehydrogenase (short-subunit alcohol dehydrogenase family)
MQLRNKTILITGGARGLGRAFARAARDAGASVAIADVLDQGVQTAKELGCDFFPVDLASAASIDECVKHAGHLDGLVNNAAIATGIGGKTLEEIDIDTWDRVMSVNVRGTWLMTRACLPALTASKGRIVNIASDTALWGAPRLMHYVASKGAVIAMTRAMARELGQRGISVNAIAPGLTLVEATEYVPKERHDLYVDGRAIKRAQHPEDVCGALVFLLSDDAAFMTGQVLPVNGGFVMN